MLIDWTHFTPWAALAGGVLLGLASALFVLLNGRILGISGIVGGLLRPRAGDMGWRLAFVPVSYTHLTLPTNREV